MPLTKTQKIYSKFLTHLAEAAYIFQVDVSKYCIVYESNLGCNLSESQTRDVSQCTCEFLSAP